MNLQLRLTDQRGLELIAVRFKRLPEIKAVDPSTLAASLNRVNLGRTKFGGLQVPMNS